MKRILSVLLGIFLCLTCSACDFSFNGNSGTITVHSLPTPEITKVQDDYVYWDEVPNASSYILKINSYQESVGNTLKYSISAMMDEHLQDNTITQLHIFVKAKGNQILYADSEWSAEYTYTYTKVSGAIEKKQLETPEVTSYTNNTVYWTNVDGADKYYVKINGTEYTTLDNFYTVAFDQSQTFTFSVRAVCNADSSKNSFWSMSREFEYVKAQAGGTYLQTGIGYSIDVVTASSYNGYKRGVSVLDRSKLSEASFDKNNVNFNDVKAVSSHSVEDLVKKSTITTELSVGNNTKKKILFCNLSAGLTSSASFDYSDYSSKYYYALDHYIERYSLSLVDYAVEDTYTEYLSAGYLKKLNELYNNQSTQAFFDFFDLYGTHLIGSGIFGGRLNTYFSAVTNKATIDSSTATALGAKIDFGMSKVNNTSASVQATIASELHVSASDISTSFNATAYGGNAFGASSIDDFNANYKTWWDSFNTDSASSVLINFSEDGLIALWDLLPDEYSSMENAMKTAFDAYYLENYNNVIDDFAFDGSCTVSFESNGGSEVAPISKITYGQKINAPAAPTKAGYQFAGWYTDPEFSESSKFDFTQQPILSSCTLYAKWEELLVSHIWSDYPDREVSCTYNIITGLSTQTAYYWVNFSWCDLDALIAGDYKYEAILNYTLQEYDSVQAHVFFGVGTSMEKIADIKDQWNNGDELTGDGKQNLLSMSYTGNASELAGKNFYFYFQASTWGDLAINDSYYIRYYHLSIRFYK